MAYLHSKRSAGVDGLDEANLLELVAGGRLCGELGQVEAVDVLDEEECLGVTDDERGTHQAHLHSQVLSMTHHDSD